MIVEADNETAVLMLAKAMHAEVLLFNAAKPDVKNVEYAWSILETADQDRMMDRARRLLSIFDVQVIYKPSP